MIQADTISSIGNLANLGMFFVTLAVAIFGIYQFLTTQRLTRSQTAKEIYADYLKFSFENPRFADPSLARVDYVEKTFDESGELFGKYEWFVSYMIMAYEEIYFLSDEPSWANTMRENLANHARYFASDHFERSGYFSHIDGPLASQIREVSEVMRRSLPIPGSNG